MEIHDSKENDMLEEESVESFVGTESETRDEVRELHHQSRGDNSRVCIGRAFATGALLLTAVAVTWTTFIFLKEEEEDDFETAFYQFARTLADASIEQESRRRKAFSSLSSSISIDASNENMTWPFVKFLYFEEHAKYALSQSKAELGSLLPIVYDENRAAFEAFTAEHNEEVHAAGFKYNPENLADFQPIKFKPYISQRKDGEVVPADTKKTYTPIWHTTPPRIDYASTNSDISGVPDYHSGMTAAHSIRALTYTGVRNMAFTSSAQHAKFHSKLSDESLFHPHSFGFQPVFQEAGVPSSDIVAYLGLAIAWDVSMRNLLPSGLRGMICVVQNNCDDVFTYEIDGPEAYFLGFEDLHDPSYNHMQKIVNLTDTSIPKTLDTPGHCHYQMSIYPSETMESIYDSDTPEKFAIIVASTFVAVAIAFLVYDFLVRRRNDKLIDRAARSNALVNSVFPGPIRDRLLQESGSKMNKNKNNQTLRGFMTSKAQTIEDVPNEEKPLADLFLETTIIFADIVGFTAWSSSREPSQVFQLLESVYSAFDELAKHRRVFKVETVGDCYVAVVGIPNARKDHAVVMARFARDIMKKMLPLVRDLELSLGPGTADLSLRVGIHSGPVTAGVLRGERARFQLFGDTMNTTARIESSGAPGRIHLSKETAESLAKMGKGHWVTARADRIIAKGKGEIQTFWLQEGKLDDATTGSQTDSSSPADSAGLLLAAGTEGQFSNSVTRLVDWNVKMLEELLKQILARRMATRSRKGMHFSGNRVESDQITRQAEAIEKSGALLDEVQEIITLPEYDKHASRQEVDPETVVLDRKIKEQLKDYVSGIANMYRNNSFHNFEHASHVTMSVIKLLSRIVAPSEILEADNATKKSNKKDSNEFAASLHDHTYGITSDPLTQFSCAFSALIHDVDHTGVPNSQLVKEKAGAVALYGERSVAEQNSLDLAWNWLMDDRFLDLRSAICATPAELRRFRQLVVNSVLATDIVDKELKALRNARWDKAFHKKDEKDVVVDTSHDAVNRKATIVIEHLIQASDVAHTMQHWHVYRKWNERFFLESYKAYQDGRAEKDPSQGWYKGELGFFDFYVIPLAKKLKECGVFGVSSDEYLSYAEHNRAEWAERGQAVVAEMMQKVVHHDVEHDSNIAEQ